MDPSPTSPIPLARRRVIAGWLLLGCGLVFAMVVIGGLTRLTHSGLSMVDWRPITGWLPPMDEATWQKAFDAYKQYPEYQKVNLGMSLTEFKEIFWLEFFHRLLGRIIGVVFFVPLVFFAVRRWLDRRLGLHLTAMLLLGGLQGVVGWYMVKSGLVDRPDVSQYRLALHLMMAVAVLAYMLWIALNLLWPEPTLEPQRATLVVRRGALVLLVWATLTVASGAFVAGLDAGMDYNTFPLMDGALVPAGLLELQPAWLNLFENHTTVQFVHRTLAELFVVGVSGLWWWARKTALVPRARRMLNTLLAVTIVQVALGIATLLLVVPVPLASAHQAGAIVVFTAALITVHCLRPRPG